MASCAALLGQSLVSHHPLPTPIHLSPTALALLAVAAAFGKAVGGTIASFAQCQLAGTTAETIRNSTLHSLLDHGLAAPQPQTVSRLASRIRDLERAVQDGVLASARALAQLLPLLAALFFASRTLTLLTLAVALPFGLVLARSRRATRTYYRRWNEICDTLHAEIDDLVAHNELWRTYGTGTIAADLIARLGRRATSSQATAETLRNALSSANEVLGALALAGAIAVGTLWPTLDGGHLIAFATVFFMAYRPLRDLGDARAWLARGDDALQALSEVPLRPPVQIAPQEPLQAISSAEPLLAVCELGVPGMCPPVSLSLAQGEILAIQGPPGSGKTTFLRALLGLEPAAVGSVRLQGHLVPAGCVGPSARPFAWVPQHAPVVSGTLHDNLALAGADESSANDQLDRLGASDLRRRIACVKLGAGGRGLSGGEMRWLSLARALASGLPVLLLDEPTTGLDPCSKAQVIRTIASLRGHRSILVVTHDPDMASAADRSIELPAAGSASTVAAA